MLIIVYIRSRVESEPGQQIIPKRSKVTRKYYQSDGGVLPRQIYRQYLVGNVGVWLFRGDGFLYGTYVSLQSWAVIDTFHMLDTNIIYREPMPANCCKKQAPINNTWKSAMLFPLKASCFKGSKHRTHKVLYIFVFSFFGFKCPFSRQNDATCTYDRAFSCFVLSRILAS